MTYDTYRYIFIGAAILCGIMFVVSLVIFIVLNIPKVISDLSGATARKAIKNIREQNEASGDKTHKVSAVNRDRGRLTDKISPTGNIIQSYGEQMHLGITTTKIDTQELPDENALEGTAVLGSYNETAVLGGETAGETSVLSEVAAMEEETSVLSVDVAVAGETSVLSELNTENAFVIEYDITFIHTNESIGQEVGI